MTGPEWVQRELRFRAWDTTTHDKGVMELDVGLERAGGYHESMSHPIMQATGIRDKNGVEVYEGDIVYDDTIEQRGVVKYGEFYKDVDGYGHHGTFTGYHVEYIGEGDGSLPYRDLYCADMSMEVIGNIFENPELLEGEPDSG